MRRLIVISALWLGLLGMAEPLLACAMNTPASGCCPTGTQAPCDQDSDQGTALADANVCCASAPVGQPLTVSIKKSDAKALHDASGSADSPLIVASSLHEPLAPTTHQAFRLRLSAPAQNVGAETYLRTGRLRL